MSSTAPYTRLVGYHSGLVDTSLQAAIGRGFKTRAKDLGPAGKLTMMLGALVHEDYHGVFHGKAVNLARKLCEEYNRVLQSCDVLVMPTIIKKTPKVPEKEEIDFGE